MKTSSLFLLWIPLRVSRLSCPCTLSTQPLMNDISPPPPIFLGRPFYPLLPPKTTAHQSAVSGWLILPYHCAVISACPDHPSFSFTVYCVLFVCVCVCVVTRAVRQRCILLPENLPCLPSNGPWKLPCSLSAAAEISWKLFVWSVVIEKQSGQEHQEVCLAFGSQFIAVDVSEDNHWQLCNPLNPTSKDDKVVGAVWQLDRLKWAADIRCGHSWITHLKFMKVYGEPV